MKSLISNSLSYFVSKYMHKKTRAELAITGMNLAVALEQASHKYHVKSDQHGILLWESAVVRAKSEYLQRGTEILENLRESTLLSSWGKSFQWSEQEILENVRDFHSKFEKVRLKKSES